MRRGVDENTQTRVVDPVSMETLLQLMRDVKRDQKDSFQRIDNAILDQAQMIGQIARDTSTLAARVTILEHDLSRQNTELSEIKSRQDSCLARLTHEDDTTEIRKLRELVAKRGKATIPPGHTTGSGRPYKRPSKHPMADLSGAKRAVLMALAGLLVAATSALTTYFALPKPEPVVEYRESFKPEKRGVLERSGAKVEVEGVPDKRAQEDNRETVDNPPQNF
jgi:hypothetical protein